MPLRGNSEWRYDPGTGVVVVPNNAPLREIEPVETEARARTWSWDGSASETFYPSVILAGVRGVLRYINNPSAVLLMLRWGARGVALNYYPDTVGQPTTFYPFRLVEPGGPEVRLARDRDRWTFGEYEVAVEVRRTDGGSVAGLL